MKSNSILICIVLFSIVLNIDSLFMKTRKDTWFFNLFNKNKNEKVNYPPGSFDASKITKYYRDQKPLNTTSSNKAIQIGFLTSNGTQKNYIDDFFPPTFNSIEGKDAEGNTIDPNTNLKAAAELISKDPKTLKIPEFKRAAEIFRDKKFKVFKDAIQPKDVIQNELGNCYFLSAIAALTEYPQLIYQLFRTNTANSMGYYEVVLFIDGEWQVVILDDYFVVYGGKTPIKPKFAQPNGKELWVMLLEKAWAKVNRGYVNIVNGKEEDAFQALTGFSSKRMSLKNISYRDLFNILKFSLNMTEIITATSIKRNSTDELVINGIVREHSYTIVGAVNLKLPGSKDSLGLIKLRNPWGIYEWTGDWSDNSTLWTPELKNAVNLTKEDDGIFFMKIDDFLKYFGKITKCDTRFRYSVKSYVIDKKELFTPVVFNLNLEEDKEVIFNIFVRNRRFNRGEGKNPDVVSQIMIGKYDEKGNIEYVNSKCSGKPYLDLKIRKKGKYVLWVYNSYFTKSDSNSYQYVLRVLSQSLSMNFQKVGLDKNGIISRKIINSKYVNLDKDEETGLEFYIESQPNNMCIAVAKFFFGSSNGNFLNHKVNTNELGRESLKSHKNRHKIRINFDTDKFSNIASLAPFDRSSIPKKFRIKLERGSTFIFLGIQATTKESDNTWLQGITSGFENDSSYKLIDATLKNHYLFQDQKDYYNKIGIKVYDNLPNGDLILWNLEDKFGKFKKDYFTGSMFENQKQSVVDVGLH